MNFTQDMYSGVDTEYWVPTLSKYVETFCRSGDFNTFAAGRNPQSMLGYLSDMWHGILLDFFAEGEREKLFSDAAFDLRSDGEISEVIETGRGVEILQRVSKKGIKFKSLDEVKGEIKKKVSEQQFQKLFSINARRTILNSVKDPAAFDKFVKAKGASKAELKNAVAKEIASLLDKISKKKLNELAGKAYG